MDCSFRHSWSRAHRIPSEPCLSLPLSLLPSLLCFLCAGFVLRQAFSKMDSLAVLGLYHPNNNPRRKSFFSGSSSRNPGIRLHLSAWMLCSFLFFFNSFNLLFYLQICLFWKCYINGVIYDVVFCDFTEACFQGSSVL